MSAQFQYPVVAVLNMKGGVGKTTISANVMRQLYPHVDGKTSLIDFDPQYNLSQLLLKQSSYEDWKELGLTMQGVMQDATSPSLLTVTTAPGPPPLAANISISLRQDKHSGRELRLVLGDFSMVKYSLIDQASNSLVPIRNRFRSFVQQARTEGIVCIDCNPSSSFLTVSALEVATHVLVPVRPDRFSMLGLDMLYSYVDQLSQLQVKPKFIVLLNDIPRSNYDPAVEDLLRAHPTYGSRTLSEPLYKSSALSASQKHTGFACDRRGPYVGRAIKNLETVALELKKELRL
ncbi:ParA family protein [Stenotrophomonas maltophilia]|nr:ParA family protein [Stenotrophomonas maltophilia]